MTKKHFHTSLQLKLTLLLSLLMIVSCVLMYFFISHSAVSGMDGLQNYMIKVDPQDGDSPITFNVDPKALFPQFEQEIQETSLRFIKDQTVVLGLITSKFPELEDKETVKARIIYYIIMNWILFN